MKKFGQAGFTITELMISIFLASAVSVLMFGLSLFLYADQLRVSARADLTLESQVFLRRLIDDIRVAGGIRPSNQLDPIGAWQTDDPANILVMTFPATDINDNFIADEFSGQIYENEVIYYSIGNNMYRKVIANPNAIGNTATTSCTPGTETSSCPVDTKITGNLQNLLFEFYDTDDQPTTDIINSRAVQLTVNLNRLVYGEEIGVSVSSKAAMRNAK